MSIKIFLKVTFITAFLMVGFSSKAQELPPDLKGVYKSKPNSKLSDEFNGNRKKASFDTKKWHFRKSTKAGLGQGEKYVQEKDGILTCYGIKSERKAGAIVSNDYFQYGFYAFKWKTTGIPHNKRNVWHPSVWGSLDDTRKNWVPGTRGKGDSWMEIDIMEFSTGGGEHTDWSSDAPAYIWTESLQKKVKVNKGEGPGFGWKKAIMIDGKKDTYNGEVIGKYGHDQWQILGMEYHPDYLQMWKKDGDKWVKIGNIVNFTDDDTMPTLRTVPKKAVKPLYWYMGSLYFTYGKTPIREEQIRNSSFQVDWFHFHSLKK